MRVLSLKLKKQVKEDLNLMATIMKEISKMVNLKAKVNTTLQILVRFIKENSMKTT
jgi:hypothetical protein